MVIQARGRKLGCAECMHGEKLAFDFTMAFQPIINVETGYIFAHEALARGLNGEPAGFIFEQVNAGNRYRFDQQCRVKAIQLGAQLGIRSNLSINFMPNAVYEPERCIRTTLEAANEYNFPVNRIIFEITEAEKIDDHQHLRQIIQYYKSRGFLTAIDDFGAGYAGLNLLADIQTDLLKLDMALVRNVHQDRARQSIIKGILLVCQDLGIKVIAEGIESYEEMSVLRDFGIQLFQGYYFAKPVFRSLATPSEHWVSPSKVF